MTVQVSIGMPVFNDKPFVAKALDSLLSQTFTDFELIISDDQSTDGSAEICKEYAARDSRIRYVRQEKNLGISLNMMFLLEQAQGEFFMWAANDDLWHPEFIANLKSALESNPQAISAFGPMHFIDEDDNKLEDPLPRAINYSDERAFGRLNKLIHEFDDGFGYGLFRRSSILDVQFPQWVWPNHNCPYNNIYPTLCFYLSRGNFAFSEGEDLWYNRLKKDENVHHKTPYNGTVIRGSIAYFLRKLNLIVASAWQCYRGSKSIVLPLSMLPKFIWKWWLNPSYIEFRRRLKHIGFRNRLGGGRRAGN